VRVLIRAHQRIDLPARVRGASSRASVEPRQLQISGLRHEIFNEPEHVRVFEDVLAWVRARSG
jgi:alpha-beta hydrolase superfamily lysophospholipase